MGGASPWVCPLLKRECLQSEQKVGIKTPTHQGVAYVLLAALAAAPPLGLRREQKLDDKAKLVLPSLRVPGRHRPSLGRESWSRAATNNPKQDRLAPSHSSVPPED